MYLYVPYIARWNTRCIMSIASVFWGSLFTPGKVENHLSTQLYFEAKSAEGGGRALKFNQQHFRRI